MKQENQGFTLIELVVVIALLGILLAIAIPAYSGYVSYAKNVADKATLGHLNRVTQIYYTEEPTPNIFEVVETSDAKLLQILVDVGFFQEKPAPQQKNVAFIWNHSAKIWQLSNNNSSVYSLSSSDITLGINGQKGYIKGSYSSTEKDIIIPNSLNGVIITNIWQEVFENKGLTTIRFPEDSKIVRIHARAFNKNNLTEVVLPNSLRYLDFGAFWNNNEITKVTLGSGVVLQDQVFRNSNSFNEAYLLNGAGTYLFENGIWTKQ